MNKPEAQDNGKHLLYKEEPVAIAWREGTQDMLLTQKEIDEVDKKGVMEGDIVPYLKAQLAKVQPEIDKLKEESKARHELIMRLTARCEELQKHRLDRPDLVEIARVICNIYPQCAETDWKCPCIPTLKAQAKQILSLFETDAIKWTEEILKAKKQVACALYEEIICPMCYRLNPQHVTMDNGKGCHYCQEREDWRALKSD